MLARAGRWLGGPGDSSVGKELTKLDDTTVARSEFIDAMVSHHSATRAFMDTDAGKYRFDPVSQDNPGRAELQAPRANSRPAYSSAHLPKDFADKGYGTKRLGAILRSQGLAFSPC
jgi:hypothetical protein